MLTNRQIRNVGKKILLYRPLPIPKEFHKSLAKNRWLCGGNRSSKSESNIGYDLSSFALGVHPYRRTPKNATIWAGANAWALVGKLLWMEKIKSYLPISQIHSINWHNKSAEIPAELRLVNGNRIEFKAYEQGRKAFEGRAIDAFYGDEQCKSDSEGIWIEIQARLMDKNGFSAQSMTPIIPQAWLEERIEGLPETDDVFYADLNDNRKSRGGYVDDKEIDFMISQWPAEIQETRIKGYFAAFAGAVYKTFKRDTHVIKPFEIPKDWPRYRAVDFGYNNPLVCLWFARDSDRRWYVYAEHYQARETLAYHAEKIKQISGSEKYRVTWADWDSQDRHELDKLGITTLPAKKDIHLGIEAVQAALKVQGDGKPRLFIFKNCTHTIKEMTGYKWAEGTESKDPTDEPLKVNDHTCLVAGTMVTTDKGEKPIEQIQIGDEVLTRQGYCPVVAAGMTYNKADVVTAVFSDSTELTGTKEHPVFVQEKGFIPLDALRYGDIIISLCETKKSYTKTYPIEDTLIQKYGRTERTTKPVITPNLGQGICTGKYGKMPMVKSLKDTKFTTETGIHLITNWIISNVKRGIRINRLTANITIPKAQDSLKALFGRLLNGIGLPRGASGIAYMLKRYLRIASRWSEYVSNAVRSLTIWPEVKRLGFAQITARQKTGATVELITKQEFVPVAGNRFQSINTIKRSVAQKDAVVCIGVTKTGRTKTGRSPVYNLTVDKAHEYYANGILVSNCDSLRYAIYGVEGKFVFSESDLS